MTYSLYDFKMKHLIYDTVTWR